jgi:hypothetical protein
VVNPLSFSVISCPSECSNASIALGEHSDRSKGSIAHQAAEEEERKRRAADEREHQEGEQIERMVHGVELFYEDEDNGYGDEGADEEFARRHHDQDDVIDEVIAMSELESNPDEHER